MTCKRHVIIAPNDEKQRGLGLAYTTVLIYGLYSFFFGHAYFSTHANMLSVLLFKLVLARIEEL